MIRDMLAGDWAGVRAIYEAGLATGQASFETAAPAWEAWDARHLDEPRLVLEEATRVVGFAALSPVSARPVYEGVAEVSIYVAADGRGRGRGRALLDALVRASEEAGIWTLQAGIFPENEASAALHRALGFRLIGVHERLGVLGGTWRDVALYERRSPSVGR